MSEETNKNVVCHAHVYEKDKNGPYAILYYADPNKSDTDRSSVILRQDVDIWHRVRFDLLITHPEIVFKREKGVWLVHQILLPYDIIHHFDKPIFPNGHPTIH